MKKCFIACPIGTDDSKVRRNSDFLLQSIIKPALESDFEIQRSDLISSTNKITDEIIGGLTNSELVIVDLSTHNPNVFYELGYRHALERPTITMINKDENIPFDVSAYRTIYYSELYADVVNAKDQLKETIKTFTDNDFNFENPVNKYNNIDNEYGVLNRHLLDIKSDLSELKEFLPSVTKQDPDIPVDSMVRMMELAVQYPDQFERLMELQNKNSQ
ncbi:putative phage SAP-26 protein [Staphylococcus aureus]|nr:putative phage SAP-26 protein [Staphylococcus aureus]